MADLSFVVRGLIIGFSIAAPVGPIGVLCMRRSLANGRTCGLISGLGAATADAVYGCIAGFGLTSISDFLLQGQMWLRLIGGFFLCFLGVKTFLAKPSEKTASAKGNGLLGAYASTFFLTLTNPVTILSFAAIFAGLGLGSVSGNYFSSALLVIGVFIGSALWWLILSTTVNAFRERITSSALRWVNRIAGTILITFGIISLFSLVLAN